MHAGSGYYNGEIGFNRQKRPARDRFADDCKIL